MMEFIPPFLVILGLFICVLGSISSFKEENRKNFEKLEKELLVVKTAFLTHHQMVMEKEERK